MRTVAVPFEDYKWIHRKLTMQAAVRQQFPKHSAAHAAWLTRGHQEESAGIVAFIRDMHAKREAEDARAAELAARHAQAVKQVSLGGVCHSRQRHVRDGHLQFDDRSRNMRMLSFLLSDDAAGLLRKLRLRIPSVSDWVSSLT